MIPPYLSRLLADADLVDSEHGPLRLTVETLGTVHLPTGRIVGCDATDPGPLPYARQVEPGGYPVLLTGARLPDGEEYIAAACLRCKDAPPVRWEAAHWKGQNPRRHPRPAYAVDSSLGAFMSLEAAGILADLENLGDLVFGAVDTGPNPGEAMFAVPGSDRLNAAIFGTGFGDGVYASYWGLDAAGEPVCLLTDYQIAGFPDPADAAPARPWWQFWRRA